MTTGVALPLTLGFRMAGFRRGPPDNLPQTSHVRRNLFGPIDHEENLKFVQEELNKISQADCKRWNFDFQAEKPQEGRYSWEPVSEKVPQAYEMQAMSSQHLPQQTGDITATEGKVTVRTHAATHTPEPHAYLPHTQAPTSIRTSTTESTERITTPTPPPVTTTTTTTTTTAKKGPKRKAERTENEGDRGGGGGGAKRLKRDTATTTQLQKPISAYMKITRRQKTKKGDATPLHPPSIRTTTSTPTTTTTAATTTTTTPTPDS